jgi:hypothetical protein
VLAEKPGGGFYISDPHHGGNATRLKLVEIAWGRLVDVHDVDAAGNTQAVPLLRDVVIHENVLTDVSDYVLDTNAITHKTRLVIRHPRDTPRFQELLRRATNGLAPVLPKKDSGNVSLPVSLVPRNAALLLTFDDLLEDGEDARALLLETVRLVSGYPPRTPQPARIVFDPNHGGLRGSEFHSTRVLVDLTVSVEDLADVPIVVPVNVVGVPASSTLSPMPDAALRLPTRIDQANGQFVRLTNLAGRPLLVEGPADTASGDLVRAWRSGNSNDANGGFLLDLLEPTVISAWPVTVEAARDDAAGVAGLAFEIDVKFRTPCRAGPRAGDVFALGGVLYEVVTAAPEPDSEGRVTGVRVLSVARDDPTVAGALLGMGTLHTPYRGITLDPACWVTFVPAAEAPPSAGLSTRTRVTVRFSEPMDPQFFFAFDNFRLLRGRAGIETPVRASDLVIADVRFDAGLQEIELEPRFPLANDFGLEYGFEMLSRAAGPRDLGGNPLPDAFPRVTMNLAPDQPLRANGGLALRFADPDELLPPLHADLRGQVVYDDGLLRPRPSATGVAVTDRTNPLTNLMQPFPSGVQTPVSPLGSKMQAVWRYADFGWRVMDEAYHNLDVVGLSLSPADTTVVADFYPEFEMRMAHSRFLPDETAPGAAAPKYPVSGLLTNPHLYVENLLDDPRSPQQIVHARGLGFRLRPSDRFIAPTGTPMVPFPWNRSGGARTFFLWRDTAVTATGGAGSSGIPMDVEVRPPLVLEPEAGAVAQAGNVPTIGLPLLWEIRCYPTNNGLGLNPWEVLLPINGWARPNFRAYSTGGFNTEGRAVAKNPDLQPMPTGGFNPGGSPPGTPTALTADNTFYVGQLDYQVRVSRAHTIWIDTVAVAPTFAPPVVEPRTQVDGTSVLLEFRGADGFTAEAGEEPFDAAQLTAYGDPLHGEVVPHGTGAWSTDIRDSNGARYLQLRFSFFNDVESGISPELDAVGIAFQE